MFEAHLGPRAVCVGSALELSPGLLRVAVIRVFP